MQTCPNCGKSNLRDYYSNSKANSPKRKKGLVLGAIFVSAAITIALLLLTFNTNFRGPALSAASDRTSSAIPDQKKNYDNATSYVISDSSSSNNDNDKLHSELKQYALQLINEDRQKAGLSPVVLSSNEAAQSHAEDMLKARKLTHWTTDGMKPYMRYSVYGGTGYVAQNAAIQMSETPDAIVNYRLDLCKLSDVFCIKAQIEQAIRVAEHGMVYDDVNCCDNGHRDNILDKYHTHVSLGIAFNSFDFAYVQNFENNYVEWNQQSIHYDNNTKIVTMSGKTKDGYHYSAIEIVHESLPTPQTYLDNLDKRSYGFGDEDNNSRSKPHWVYPTTSRLENDTAGFSVGLSMIPIINDNNNQTQEGVYTLIMWVSDSSDKQHIPTTSYSIFVK
jgi:hypothetical protein